MLTRPLRENSYIVYLLARLLETPSSFHSSSLADSKLYNGKCSKLIPTGSADAGVVNTPQFERVLSAYVYANKLKMPASLF